MKPIGGASMTLSVSVTATASTAAALGSTPASGTMVRLVNEGPNNCYVHLGGTGVVATVPDGTAVNTATPVLAGSDVVVSVGPSQTHISAICRTGETATLIVQSGEGV